MVQTTGTTSNVKAGYARIRDHAFTINGAHINEARRKTQGSNQSWRVQVNPNGNSTISITLPETTNCSNAGAICIDDGRKLSHSTSDTVLGPVGISIADAEVEEGANAVLVFAVALSRAASSQMTVDYTTSDGTATAGADYTSTSGTLTINAGSSSGSIEVGVIDDQHNEGSETFTLTLSNASSGDLTDSSATGTITNHDALPKALVARFGRTAAVHIVEQVEERVNAPRRPGFDGRVAGREINRDMGQQFALDFLQQLGGGYGYHQGQPGARMTAAGTNDPRFTNSGMTSSLGPQNAIGGAMNPSGSMQGVAPRPVLRPRDGDGPGQRPAAARLELGAQPGDVERRRPLVLEPERAVAVLRAGRRPRAQRRRPDLDVRRGLFQGPDGHRHVAGAHSRFPGHALTPTGVMAIRCKQFHLPDL